MAPTPTVIVTSFDAVPVIFLLPPEVVAGAKTKTIVPTVLDSGRESFSLA